MGMDGEGGFADAGAVTPEFDDGAVAPDSDGARTPSDGEVASESERVTIRVQSKGCYRVLCLSFRMLLVERAGLCSLTRACM